MKKIIVLLIGILFFVGCNDLTNTPTKKVEEFLGKYQMHDEEVLSQLEEVMDNEVMMTENQKNEYEEIMKKQYKDLTYKIKDEVIEGDNATVEVEIEVYDYYAVNDKLNTYIEENQEEFYDEEENIIDEKYMDKKIEYLKEVTEKVTYTLNLTLTKDEDNWKLDNITETERQKIHGLYNY